jgi:hypothetical protein
VRNLEVFTRVPVPVAALEQHLTAKGAFVNELDTPGRRDREAILAVDDHVMAYVALDTALAQAVFDDESLRELCDGLGFKPSSCVDVHFTSGERSFALAEGLAREFAEMWDGVIDYSGAGGGIGQRPVR